MSADHLQELTTYFRGYISEHKQELFEKVLNKRTNYLTVVLEDIYQPQNASAVVRTCDCLGIQQLHVIENENEYELNKNVVLGSYKWVDIIRYNERTNNTSGALNSLKKKGYRIILADPDPNANTLDELNLEAPCAIVFGTEKVGLSDTARALADDSVTIPMCGFTESFNISVSAALIIHTLRKRLEEEAIDFKLKDHEKDVIRLEWYKKMVKQPDLMEKEYLKRLLK